MLGYTANAASSSIAIGHLAVASATESIAIGNSTPTAAGARSIAIGRGANVGSSGTESMAFGYGTSTNNANCIVMGRGATSTAANQFVLGADGYAISQVFIGEGVTAATVPANISINPTGASGTDTAGNCVFYINGARGTGTGAGGDIVFQTAPPGTTGSTPGTLTERLRIQDTGEIQFTGNDIDSTVTRQLRAKAARSTCAPVTELLFVIGACSWPILQLRSCNCRNSMTECCRTHTTWRLAIVLRPRFSLLVCCCMRQTARIEAYQLKQIRQRH